MAEEERSHSIYCHSTSLVDTALSFSFSPPSFIGLLVVMLLWHFVYKLCVKLLPSVKSATGIWLMIRWPGFYNLRDTLNGRTDAAFPRSMSARCPAGLWAQIWPCARQICIMPDRVGMSLGGGSRARAFWVPANSATLFATLFLCLPLLFRRTGPTDTRLIRHCIFHVNSFFYSVPLREC